jgi:hypothetical protein
MQPGIRIAATVQKVKHSAIVGLYMSKEYTAVTNAAVQPDTSFNLSITAVTIDPPVENAPKTQL